MQSNAKIMAADFSPHVRGVILYETIADTVHQTFPRMCGGDPEGDLVPIYLDDFSPHTRG